MIKSLRDPKLPTKEEVEKHNLIHLPYRDWCPICVKANNREMDHEKDNGKDRKLPEYSFDYCFPGDEFGYRWTILVGKERSTKAWMASTVPVKGSSGKFGVDKCLEFIEENGDRDSNIIVKTDQEPSIECLMKDLIEHRVNGKTIPEESPVKSSGSNGVVERGVQEIEGHIRALFLAFQERIGNRVDTRERIVAFIPEYAAYLVNRMNVGTDGKVAYERIKGKKPTVMGLEFGEKVLYKIKAGQRLEKINSRWDFGIFVGVRKRSNEIWVATREGIISVRSVRRIPVEKRWGKDNIEWVKWAPWNRYKDARDADGDVPEGIPTEERAKDEATGNRTIIVETRERAPREFYIRKEDAEKHGYTRGCGGCSSWFRGLGRQPHTEACRNRFRGLMKDDAKVKNNAERKRDFEERELEKKKRREEKKDEKKKRKAEQQAEDEEHTGLEGNAQIGGSDSSRGDKRALEGEEEVEIAQIITLVDEWVADIEKCGVEAEWNVAEAAREEDEQDEEIQEEILKAWDDVHGGDLP